MSPVPDKRWPDEYGVFAAATPAILFAESGDEDPRVLTRHKLNMETWNDTETFYRRSHKSAVVTMIHTHPHTQPLLHPDIK